LKKLAAAERTVQALGANIEPESHIALLRQAQDFLRQIETAQNQTEASLKGSENLLRSVWEKSADGMRLTDEEGVIVEVNNAYCKMVGMKREELEGKPFIVTYSDRENLQKILLRYEYRFKDRAVEKLV